MNSKRAQYLAHPSKLGYFIVRYNSVKSFPEKSLKVQFVFSVD